MSEAAPWELAVDAHDQIGEGPSWDIGDQSLLWVDIAGQRVWRLDPVGGSTWQRTFDQMVGAVLPRATGGLVLCLQDGVWLTDSDEGPLRSLVAIEPDDPDTRLNDAKVDRAGRLWGGRATAARPFVPRRWSKPAGRSATSTTRRRGPFLVRRSTRPMACSTPAGATTY